MQVDDRVALGDNFRPQRMRHLLRQPAVDFLAGPDPIHIQHIDRIDAQPSALDCAAKLTGHGAGQRYAVDRAAQLFGIDAQHGAADDLGTHGFPTVHGRFEAELGPRLRTVDELKGDAHLGTGGQMANMQIAKGFFAGFCLGRGNFDGFSHCRKLLCT